MLDCGIHPGLSGMDALPFVDMIEADQVCGLLALLLISDKSTINEGRSFNYIYFLLIYRTDESHTYYAIISTYESLFEFDDKNGNRGDYDYHTQKLYAYLRHAQLFSPNE